MPWRCLEFRLRPTAIRTAVALFVCLVMTSAAYAYKFGEFPGQGSHQAWLRSTAEYREGTKAAEGGKNDEAIRMLQVAIETYRFDPRYYYNLALAFENRDRNGDMILAEKSYKRAIQLNPENWKYWCSLSNPLYRQGKYGEAREALLKALSKNPPAKAIQIMKGSIKEIDEASRLNTKQSMR